MDNAALPVQVDLFGNERAIKPSINREVLAYQLKAIISGLSLDEFVGLLTNKFDCIIQYAGLSNGENTGQKISLLFNPHRLDTRTSSSKHSIYKALATDSFISGLARATAWKHGKVSELLYQVIQLGINGVQYVNEFPPHIARDILLQYNIGATSKVLDPCAGWGGRMIGTSVISNYYDAYEPCTKTYSGLLQLAAFINSLDSSFKPTLHNLPFEDAVLPDGYYDFAFTSPPYYDTEIYSNESTNSLNRYASFDKWCDGFYYPLIEKTMASLKPSGVFVLNIGSRTYPLSDKLKSRFGGTYKIINKGNLLSGNAGLGREGEGESFYAISKQ